MMYTKYFAAVIHQHGCLQLQGNALQDMFNIISLESKVSVYENIDSKKYQMKIYALQQKIQILVLDGVPPRQLMEYWLSGKTYRNK